MSKPCGPGELIATLERCQVLAGGSIEDALARVVGNIGALPSRPEVHAKAVALLDCGGGLPDVAKLVEEDMGITTKLLHVANTSFYARGRHVDSVFDAVMRLGSKTVLALILAVETYEAFKTPDWIDLERAYSHSRRVGLLAASLVDRELQPRTLLAGLLYDVGVLLMGAYFPEVSKRTLKNTDQGTSETERTELGFDHASLGAHLLRLWNIGDDIAMAVAQHHELSAERDALGRALFAADRVCHNASDHPLLCDEDREWIERARKLSVEAAS